MQMAYADSMKWYGLFFLAVCAPAVAQPPDPLEVRRAVQAGKIRPLAEILGRVQASHEGARVLDVDLERGKSGQQWYEITLLNRDGQRVEVYVDAESGQDIRNPRELTARTLPLAEVVRLVTMRHAGSIREVELEEGRDGRPVYEVEMRLPNGSELHLLVDALTGEMTASREPELQRPATPALPLHEIIQNVERRFNGRAEQFEAKRSIRGRPYYEIELQLSNGRGLEVNVDPVTGQVLREEDLH